MVKLLKASGYNVKSPEREDGNAGIDFYIPEYTETFEKIFKEKNSSKEIENKEYILVAPNFGILIPSGYYTKFPKTIALIGHNRSSVATRLLFLGACVDDSIYQGMLFIHIVNLGTEYVKISLGKKIAQFVPVLIDAEPIELYDESTLSKSDFFGCVTSRGAGGFGSTDK